MKTPPPETSSSATSPSSCNERPAGKKVVSVMVQLLMVLIIMIAMIWGRAYYSQQKFFSEGEQALKVYNLKEAVTGYEWAIRMYTPFSSRVRISCERLWNIGLEYEKRGHLDWALMTYRSLRSAIYAIRSFYTPHEEWIARTDSKIRLILEAQKAQEQLERAKSGRVH